MCRKILPTARIGRSDKLFNRLTKHRKSAGETKRRRRTEEQKVGVGLIVGMV